MRFKNTTTALFTMMVSLACIKNGFAQTPMPGFVQQENIKMSGIYFDYQTYSLSTTDKSTARVYTDGFGRTIQTIGMQASPSQYDLIQPVAYDNLGRQTKSYLPYAGQSADAMGSYRPSAISDQASFYSNGLSDKVADDVSPYANQGYEFSPMQRVLAAGRVGDGFQAYASGAHYKTFNYRSNNSTADGSILIWGPDGSNQGTYAANALSVAEGTDEDGVKLATFTDFAGHTVLKRQYTGTAGIYQDTYYIYNEAGMVSYVIPPKALTTMIANSNNYSLTQAGVIKLIFQFMYDEHGRLIQKTVPGKGPMNMIYDPLNRLVLTQDAAMAANYKWYYVKYDAKNHAISQGIYTDPNSYSPSAMQTAVNSTTVFFETRNTTAADGYYTNSTFPSTGIVPLAYSYYDNYDMDMNGTDDYSYSPQGLTNEVAPSNVPTRGMLTMTRQTTVGSGISSGTWLVSYMFYDSNGRVVQTQTNNQITTSISDVKTNVLDFTGLPTQTKVHKNTGGTTIDVISTLGYDHMQRIKTIDQSYNGATAIRIAAYDYNEIGQLVTKNLHSTNSGASYLQSVDYRYNINGQLLSINNSKLSSDWGSGSGYTNNNSNDVFGMQFMYDKPDAGLSNTSYYSGKLAAVKWMSKDGSGTSTNERSYTYAYNALNQYTGSSYGERAGSSASTDPFSTNATGYDEYGITYDVNGNITALKRNSLTTANVLQVVDDLTYSYDAANPNQLSTVTDVAANATGYGFKNSTGTSGSYVYDPYNGNMTTDPYKGLNITYNDLNRTDQITITTSTGRYITYTYGAGGNVLRKQTYDGGTLQHYTDYIDGFVYVDGVISYFAMPEGRVRNIGSGALKPEYIINDNQGNARIAFEEDATNPGMAKVQQENSYYGYGLALANSAAGTIGIPNKNLYNGGSEVQDDFQDLPALQQTFYRNYDAALGRFIGVDPQAESSESFSTYQYGNNNPILFNDPLGDMSQAQLNMAVNLAFTGGTGRGNMNGGTIDPVTGEVTYFTSGQANDYADGLSNYYSGLGMKYDSNTGYARYPVGKGNGTGHFFLDGVLEAYTVRNLTDFDTYDNWVSGKNGNPGYQETLTPPSGSAYANQGGGSNWTDIGGKINALWGAVTPFVKSSIEYMRAGTYSLGYYASGWAGGSRALIKTMKFAKVAGVVGFAAGETMDLIKLYNGEIGYKNVIVNGAFGLVGFTAAAPVSIIYFGVDAFYPGGWKQIEQNLGHRMGLDNIAESIESNYAPYTPKPGQIDY